MRRRLGIVGYFVVAVSVALVLAMVGRVTAQDWRTASQEPVGLAPNPATTPEAVVQVYAARVIGWRGVFGVHTWIAVKPAAAMDYTVYEIIGWRLRWQDTALVVRHRAPDMRWFGSAPELVAEKRGAGVDGLIARIDKAAHSYPWAGEYTTWPGPNSIPSPPGCCARCPSSRPICRPPRSARTIRAISSSGPPRAGAASSSRSSASQASPQAPSRASR